MALPARVEVRQAEALPTLTLLAREGDPAAAIALSVATEAGVAESTALAALVERRLLQAGFAWVHASADADGYRLHALVNGPDQAAAFITELWGALLTPLAPTAEDVAHVASRLAPQRLPSSQAGFEAVASCQGRAPLSADEVTNARGLARVETLRRAVHVAPRMSLAVVGPYAVNEAVTHGVASLAWPQGNPPRTGPVEAEEATTIAPTPSSTTRVTVALRVGDAAAARLAAQRLGEPTSALTSRLSTLDAPFRLEAASANARLRGACLTATIEAESFADEAATAKATAVLLRELRAHVEEAARLPEARDVYRAALSAEDPREAAVLASWWSLVMPASASDPPAAAIVAQLPANETSRGDRNARFATSVRAFERELDAPRLAPRVRVESGQGRLALLLASPCGTATESAKDAGLGALTVLSAASARPAAHTDVTLEPWLSPDAIGLLAHAERRPGESARELAVRVANEAGRALADVSRAASGFHEARGLLLHELAKQGSGFDLAIEALQPSHPSWLVAQGRFDSVARQGPEAVALRARALLTGPLTFAVLADESDEQADIAARILERHLPFGPESASTCNAPGPRDPATYGLFHVDLDPTATLSRATLAFPAPAAREADRENAELLVAALDGTEGLLRRALAGFPHAVATARLHGGSLASALVIDVQAPHESLDPAVARLRETLQRVAEGALGTHDFERARTELERKAFFASLDPRKRIVDLVLGPRQERPPTLEGARSLAARILRDENAVLVLARPKQP